MLNLLGEVSGSINDSTHKLSDSHINVSVEPIQVIETQPTMLPILIKLIAHPHGIKLIKLFRTFYTKYQRESLFSPEVKAGLAEGLGFEEGIEGVDSVAQVRYLEIVADIAV